MAVQLTQAFLAQGRPPSAATIIILYVRMGIWVGNRVIGIMLFDLTRELKVLGT